MAQSVVEHVVADAGAFLKNVPLQDVGKNIYTLKDVVDEIRDKATRRNLAFLPYQLIFKEPQPEHIRLVTEFSKKTGDYPSLSATDIKVLALTYQLELEHVGSQHLRKEPEVKVKVNFTQRHPETPVNVAGFHFPAKKTVDGSSSRATRTHTPHPADGEQFNSFQFWREPLPSIDGELLQFLEPVEVSDSDRQKQSADGNEFNSFQFWREPLASVDDGLLDLLKVDDALLSNTPETHDRSDEDDNDDDDGGGWITPSNIRRVKMDSADWTSPADVTVGCLTTDFAVQNVLIQIGLHVLSVNGMVIKQARNHILRCHACFKTTSNMNKVFCPHCGNKTLKKLAVTVGEDGSTHMHFSRNPKVLNPKGLKHSLPLPRGGKHSSNPHLVEDQRFPQQRLSRKARQKTDVLDPDYVAGASPFCENDVYSRAASLNVRDGRCGGGRRRANPNASQKGFGRRK